MVKRVANKETAIFPRILSFTSIRLHVRGKISTFYSGFCIFFYKYDTFEIFFVYTNVFKDFLGHEPRFDQVQSVTMYVLYAVE